MTNKRKQHFPFHTKVLLEKLSLPKTKRIKTGHNKSHLTLENVLLAILSFAQITKSEIRNH
ncbi:MAG: DNA polymerase [candidate division WOR-3 bacterium]|nr:DNA polymerase [candidate division WOR-3 bacterium]